MTLYHPTGESFELTAREWLNLLAHASRYGWSSGNPQAAAIHFDLDRPNIALDGQAATMLRFEIPSGQVMSALDAHRLASAIRKGEPPNEMDTVRFRRFCGFCESGRSLLLSEYPPPPSAPNASPSPIPIESQLISLSNSLLNGLSKSPVAEPLSTEASSNTRELETAQRR